MVGAFDLHVEGIDSDLQRVCEFVHALDLEGVALTEGKVGLIIVDVGEVDSGVLGLADSRDNGDVLRHLKLL